VRRQGHDADAARDITQSYFAELLEKGYLEDYDPARGRFRVFLRTSVRNYMSKERAKAGTLRRGGHLDLVSLDSDALEERYKREPADRVTPEEIFERRWTLELLDRVLGRLRQEQQEIGSEEQFARLEGFLTGDGSEGRYREVAVHLGLSEGAVKTAVHRLRKRYGQLLRAEVAETVTDPHDIDDEVRYLLQTLV
jgi:RNA polymerase sigma-70 factor (ECF subfamily)